MKKVLKGEKDEAVVSTAVKDLFFIIATAYTLRTLLLKFVGQKYLLVTLQLLVWTFFDVLTVIPPLVMHRKSFNPTLQKGNSFLEENDPKVNTSGEPLVEVEDVETMALEPYEVDEDYEFASILRETNVIVERRTRLSRQAAARESQQSAVSYTKPE